MEIKSVIYLQTIKLLNDELAEMVLEQSELDYFKLSDKDIDKEHLDTWQSIINKRIERINELMMLTVESFNNGGNVN